MKNKYTKVLLIVSLSLITIYFIFLFATEFNDLFSFDGGIEFCEGLEENNFLMESCDNCYNVTYDYTKFCSFILNKTVDKELR